MKVLVSYVIENESKQTFRSEIIKTFGSNLPFNKCEPPSVDEVKQMVGTKMRRIKKRGYINFPRYVEGKVS